MLQTGYVPLWPERAKSCPDRVPPPRRRAAGRGHAVRRRHARTRYGWRRCVQVAVVVNVVGPNCPGRPVGQIRRLAVRGTPRCPSGASGHHRAWRTVPSRSTTNSRLDCAGGPDRRDRNRARQHRAGRRIRADIVEAVKAPGRIVGDQHHALLAAPPDHVAPAQDRDPGGMRDKPTDALAMRHNARDGVIRRINPPDTTSGISVKQRPVLSSQSGPSNKAGRSSSTVMASSEPASVADQATPDRPPLGLPQSVRPFPRPASAAAGSRNAGNAPA